MLVFILIMMYVNFEFSVDQYHEHKDHIYRIAQRQEGNMYLGNDRFAVTMAPLGPQIKQDFPEVIAATRIVRKRNARVNIENKTIFEPLVHGIDPDAFRIFTFEYLYGNPERFLKEKYSAVITESIARKYFGNETPLGKTFLFENEHEFMIAGVIKDMPSNSHFTMDIMLPFETFLEVTNNKENINNWNNSNYYTYFLLNEKGKADELEAKFPAMIEKHSEDQQHVGMHPRKLFLEEFSEIYLHSSTNFDIAPTVNVKRLYIYSSVALLILLIACINYMNLATARAATRAKEVGIRKVAGAYRYQLMAQFLGEALLFTFISLLISIMVIVLVLPFFEQFVELDLSMNLMQNSKLILSLILVCGFVGIVSGSYPAFLLSSYKPITVLKGRNLSSAKGLGMRNVLVVSQFAISGCLIISSLIITKQLTFIQDKDMGYEREHIVTIKLMNDWDLTGKMPVFKEALLKVPGVLTVTASSNLPNNITNLNKIKWPGKPEEIDWDIYSGKVDFDFVELYDIEIVEGRNFSREASDDRGAVLINESAARLLPWSDPVGRELSSWRDTGMIVGVMKDFHQHSLHQKIMPLQLFLDEYQWNVSIKIVGDHIEETLTGIERTKNNFSEKYPFAYSFLDDEFNEAYKTELKTGKLTNWFTTVTIIIACLGLYGLAAFTTDRRMKEVGIRKVLGAPVSQLIFMLSRDFTRPVLFSFLITAPIAYILMQSWLSNFAYHIDISIFTFLVTLIIMIIVAWLTISYRTFKVANINPVNSLKDE